MTVNLHWNGCCIHANDRVSRSLQRQLKNSRSPHVFTYWLRLILVQVMFVIFRSYKTYEKTPFLFINPCFINPVESIFYHMPDTCGLGNLLIRKEKVADSNIFGYV